MEVNFEYLVGDEVIVKTSKEKGKVQQRKIEIFDSGYSTTVRENYQIKYSNKPYSQPIWLLASQLELDKVDDKLNDEYSVLSVIIDTFLMNGHRNYDMVRQYNEMRNNL